MSLQSTLGAGLASPLVTLAPPLSAIAAPKKAAATPVAGMFIWVDATQITGLADGANLTNWPDESGNGNNMSQSSVNKPVYRTNGINSKPSIQFVNSTGDDIFTASNITHAQPLTGCVVFKADSSANRGWTAAGQNPYNSILSNNAGQWTMSGQSPGTDVSGGAADTNTHSLIGIFSGASSKLYIDGGLTASGNAGTTGLNSGLVAAGFADDTAGVHIGGGFIAEIIWYAFAFTAAQISAQHSYFKTKWNTP